MASSVCLFTTLSRNTTLIKPKKKYSIICSANKEKRRVRILIAGGGVGGLVLALAAKQSGFEVMVFEKDLSAVRGEGRDRGPIQLLSSALGILACVDKDVADRIMDAGCVTGNRLTGLRNMISWPLHLRQDFLSL